MAKEMLKKAAVEPNTVTSKTLHVDLNKRKVFSREPVDIIIPFHGEIAKVVALVQSILAMTRSNPYQICLVDDASPDKSFIVQAAKIPQVFTVRNEKQLGFGGALQAGFQATKQPWVIFMHSDCVVEEPTWMINMGCSLLALKSKNVHMVSAKTDNPVLDDPLLVGKKGEITEDVILKDGFLPFHCVMASRELFNKIGFIKPYPFAMYEDEEFGYRMLRYNLKQAVCGSSWVHHEGGGTINALLKKRPGLASIFNQNRQKCLEHVKKLLN